MIIKGFYSFIREYLQKYALKDCEVAIDASFFFYHTYKDCCTYKNYCSQNLFGCESDVYATFLRDYLDSLKRANVRAYFFLKSGHGEPTKMIKKSDGGMHHNSSKKQFVKRGYTKDTNKLPIEYVQPIFMHDVIKQVLEEMGFDFVICEFDAKRECIAFAQKHNCPIISYDIEFYFSGVPFIPIITYKFNLDIVDAKVFYLDDFLQKCQLNDEKLAIFIVLTDFYMFPEKVIFIDFVKALNMPFQDFPRIKPILQWLSCSRSSDKAIEKIFEYINAEDQKKFLAKLQEAKAIIRRQEAPGLPTQQIEEKNIQILHNDPQWFAKGVVAKHIAPVFVNLYHWKVVWGSTAIRDENAPDPILLCLDIFKYAFNLLTNYRTDDIKVICDTRDLKKKEEIVVPVSDQIPQPNCAHNGGYFVNGWDQIRSMSLFDHFLTYQGIQWWYLKLLPKDVKLLILALAYFTRQKQQIKKADSTIAEVCSVLVSYMVLRDKLSLQKCKDSEKHVASRLRLDSMTDGDAITVADKRIAKSILAEYTLPMSEKEVKGIFNRQWLHPLVEFQYCLGNLNHLNTLCGRPYKPTVYSNTFNGTVAYRVLYAIKSQRLNAKEFLENKLNRAPTVLTFFKRLVHAYEKITYG